MRQGRLKDDHLADVARDHNVARFASFSPGSDPAVRHLWIAPHSACADLESIVRALLNVTASVNVRVFSESPLKSAPFHYGVTSLEEAAALVRRYAADGLYTIVNETIEVNDGGVSGVSLGGIVEFAPGDTPRAVEKPGVVRASYDLATTMLSTVYGVVPDLPTTRSLRIEFSVHPRPVGYRASHTILWERELVDDIALPWTLEWPNRFSRFIGDKAFGLLVGHLLGIPVPETTVVCRGVAPFRFGLSTGSAQVWLRTCPVEQVAGKYKTTSIWEDPFALLQRQDPTNERIAAVLAQQAVTAQYSGASLPATCGDEIEGVTGSGERFMQGEQTSEALPDHVVRDVRAMVDVLRKPLGSVRTEWAHDGRTCWLLQLHVADGVSSGDVIYPGEAERWLTFDPQDGLDVLRHITAQAVASGAGVRVVRPIGTTSHVGDILRKAKVPARVGPHTAR